jgi:hypothetical protein
MFQNERVFMMLTKIFDYLSVVLDLQAIEPLKVQTNMAVSIHDMN